MTEGSNDLSRALRSHITLLASDDIFSTGDLRSALAHTGCEVVAEVHLDNLRSGLARWSPELVFIYVSRPNNYFFENLHPPQSLSNPIVITIIDDESQRTINAAIEAGVDAYLTELPAVRRLATVISVATARHRAIRSSTKELDKLRARLQERKIIERAKGVLMQRKSLDEASAYRAMQKMAMDRNVKLVELSRSMLSAAEILD